MTNTTTDTKDRELTVSRLLQAPRELVFEVWTKPEHIAQWWGPDGFTNTIQQMDVKPGGTWRFMMHGPDGSDYPNKIVYTEVVKPERLVYDHSGDGNEEVDPTRFQVIVTFEAQGNQTLLTMRSIFPSKEALEEVKKFGAVEGATQTVNRLVEFLKIMI